MGGSPKVGASPPPGETPVPGATPAVPGATTVPGATNVPGATTKPGATPSPGSVRTPLVSKINDPQAYTAAPFSAFCALALIYEPSSHMDARPGITSTAWICL